MRRLFFSAALLLGALAACGTGTDEPAAPPATGAATEIAVVPEETPSTPSDDATPPSADDESPCGADKLDRWLNVLPTEDVKSAIAATVGERAIRYYTQGDPITMDFSEARLNVELGKDGRIKLFRCG